MAFWDQFDKPSGDFWDRFDKRENSAVGDVARGLAGGVLEGGLGTVYRGAGETFRAFADPIAQGLNSLFNTDYFRAANPLAEPAESVERLGRGMKASMSDETRAAIEQSTPRGSIIKALATGDFSQLDFGANPSLKGYLYQGVDLVGQFVPQIAAAVLMRGAAAGQQVATGAAVGGFQGSGAAYEGARDNVKEMSFAELKSQSGRFNELLASGMGEEAARNKLADEAGRWASALTLPVSMAGGAFTGALLGKTGQRVLSRISESRLGRAGAAAVGGALGEGVQEVAEGVTQDIGQNIAAQGDYTGKMEVGRESFANLVLGALGGGVIGGARGATARHVDVTTGPGRSLDDVLDDLGAAEITPILALPDPGMAPPGGPVVTEVTPDNRVVVRPATYAELGASEALRGEREDIGRTGVAPNVEHLQEMAEARAREVPRLPAPTAEDPSEQLIDSEGNIKNVTYEEAKALREQRQERADMGQGLERVPSEAVPEAGWAPEFGRGAQLPNEREPYAVAKQQFQRSTTALKYLPAWAAPKGMAPDATPESILEQNRPNRLVRLAKVLEIGTKGYAPEIVAVALRDRLNAIKAVVNMTPKAVLMASDPDLSAMVGQQPLDLKTVARGLGLPQDQKRGELATKVVERARGLYTKFWDVATAEGHKRQVATAALIHGYDVPPTVLKQYPDIEKRLRRQRELEAQETEAENASQVRGDQEGVPEPGDVGTGGEGARGENLQQPAQAGAEAGDEVRPEVEVVPRETPKAKKGLTIKVPVHIAETNETREVEVNANAALKRANSDVTRWKRLMACLSK